MDVSKFREELRAKLEGQYNAARKGMGLNAEYEMDEVTNPAASDEVLRIDKQRANLDMKRARAMQKAARNAEKDAAEQLKNQEQALSDDIDYLDEGDEDISAQQGKNLLKFATNDKIAAAIMNMDEMELADFIENGLKQAGVQIIADNLETSGGGTPVSAEPKSSVPEGGDNLGAPDGETGGQEGNMRLADL